MAETRTWTRFGTVLVLAVGLLAPSASWGQAAKGKKVPAPKVEAEIEEITVVAQKREESIQEVPVSVTALTGETLEDRGVFDVEAVGQAAPNVRIAVGAGGSAGAVVVMRGTGSGNPNLSFQTAAGLYVDGAYLSKLQGSNLDLEDLERVEVLRGPQGTLYGRNTIAGAINFITRKPSDEREITLRTEAGNYDYFKVRATVNVPLIGKNGYFQSDAIGTLSLRQTVMYKSHDGYWRNQSPTNVPAGGGSELGTLNRVFSMTALRWQPAPVFTVDYSGEYHRYRNSATPSQLTFIYPGSPVSAGRPFDLTPYVRTNREEAIGQNIICDRPDRTRCNRLTDDGNHRMHILTAAYDLGAVPLLGSVTVRSISSYRLFFHQAAQDQDGSPLHGADFGSTNTVEHWSEELQWVGTAPRVHYVLGMYYYGERADQEQTQVFLNGATNLPSTIKIETDSFAPFGQITVTPPILSDRLSVTLGARYTQEQVHMDRFSQCVTVTTVIGGRPINVCNNPAIPNPALKDWTSSRGKGFGGMDGFSPMGNVAYQWTDELMSYFRIARGFKSGGFNGSTTDPRAFAIPFDPEKLLQYELGFKSQWFDNRLRLNADGYYSDYTDLQQSTIRSSPETGALTIIGNVDSAEIWGSEVEVTAVPARGVEFTATYGLSLPKFLKWLDQKFDAQNRPIFDAEGKPVLENVAHQRKFGITPQHQATFGVTYTAPPTRTGILSVHLDAYWQDQVLYSGTNITSPGIQAVKGANYALVNGRVQFVDIPLRRGSLDLAAFGQNLFDKKYRNAGVDFGAGLGWATSTYGAPRTFGLQLTYNFTAS